MSKFTHQIEVEVRPGEWKPMTGGAVGLEYGRGYIGCHREASGPRVGLRLVRSDGRVMDTADALADVSCIAPAGIGYLWPFLAGACVLALRRAAEDARRRHPAQGQAMRDVAGMIEAVIEGATW